MSTITSVFEQAQLAEAAYANFINSAGGIVSGDELKGALIASGFSSDPNDPTQSAQAAEFVSNWEVVHQYDNSESFLGIPGVFGTGFSATLFKNSKSGEYSLAIRGSLDVADYLSDANNMTANGISVSQTVDMFNYWQYLTNSGEYQAAKLVTQGVETAFMTALYTVGVANIPDALLQYFGGVNVVSNYEVAQAAL